MRYTGPSVRPAKSCLQQVEGDEIFFVLAIACELPRSHCLNLKGIQPEVIDIDLIKGDQRNAEFRQINPQMLLPAIIDGDQPVLFQSLAILEYLDETYPEPPLLPKDPRARAR